MKIAKIHHVAVICSDYQKSKAFYVDLLGCRIIKETFRADRHSYKLDLQLESGEAIELFSFPNPPQRVSHPEACGLRHLALAVVDLDEAVAYLRSRSIIVEPIRVDEITHKRFTFFRDPDDLPLELYEI